MNAPLPLVSVCIPTYRGAAHISAAIESVLAQSLTDFELLIIDDNSPDDTAVRVASHSDPRIRFLKNPSNLGPQGNWNRCLSVSRGKYFKLLPQDDLLTPSCLEKQVAILEQDTEHRLALVFCARTIVNANGRVIMKRGYPGKLTGPIPAQSVINRCLRRGTNLLGEPGSVLIRKELADQIGEFDADCPYVIDLDYWFRLLLKGDAYYLPEPLASFRVSGGSWSIAIGSKQREDFRRFIAKVAANRDFKARSVDIHMGKLMADLNNYLRIIFYRLALK
jgi:glycosyltransferase involved in cell wall biosynthesis